MVGHTGDNIQVGDVAACEHKMVVNHLAGLALIGFKSDFIAAEINAFDFLGAAKNRGQKLAQRHNDIQWVD